MHVVGRAFRGNVLHLARAYSAVRRNQVCHWRREESLNSWNSPNSPNSHTKTSPLFLSPHMLFSSFVVERSEGKEVVRFTLDKSSEQDNKSTSKKVKKSIKEKRNELRFYRILARRKTKSPNPEVRIRHKLEKAKRKEAWLIEKLMKYELLPQPTENHDPEILTKEEKHYLKRTGEKKKNFVKVGRRGLFGGVVLSMHLQWKRHETVKVMCSPCKPGQAHEYARQLAELSKGIVIDVKPNNTIIFYRGKNYVQPSVMSPPDTLSKNKAIEKYRYEQSLDHTGHFIEKLEKELEDYLEHAALYKSGNGNAPSDRPQGS